MTRRLARAVALATFAVLALPACKRLFHRQDAGTGDAQSDAQSAVDASTDASDAASDAALSRGPAYRSVTGGFQIRFPDGKAPEVEAKSIGGKSPAIYLFKVQYGTSGYVVTYDDLPRGTRTPEQVLDGARDGVLESTGGNVETDTPLAIGPHPGRNLTVSATTSGIKMRQRVRLYLVGTRLYQILVVSPFWSAATAIEQDFLDSFELLPDAGP